VFLVFSALLCCYTTLISGSYDTSSYFTYLIFTFVILIPILTMRLFAEERKLRTEQLLLTAPVTITGMVLGKYFAALTMYVMGILLSCVNFLPLYIIGAAERAGESDSLTHIGPVTGEIVGSLLAIILLGAALIAVGADLLVDNAIIIAEKLGVSEKVIGLTIVALGTSLPEFVTAITSLIKGHGALSLGNIIGANIFNLVLVSGMAVTISPFEVPVASQIGGMNASLVIDIPVMFLVMGILTVPTLLSKKLSRWQGISMLAIYVAFCTVQFIL
jgi:Ca2+/Na+ antiporter